MAKNTNGKPDYLVDPQLDLHPLGTNRKGGEAMHPRYLVDVDGKVPYTVYENKPELYDIDGKHEYKYFSQMKHLEKSQHSGGSDQSNSNNSAKASTSASISMPKAHKQSEAQVHEGSPTGYDMDGKFSYTVYNPKLHKHLFKTKNSDNSAKASTSASISMPNIHKQSEAQVHEGSHDYDMDGKFGYTVYNPKLHKHLFKTKAK